VKKTALETLFLTKKTEHAIVDDVFYHLPEKKLIFLPFFGKSLPLYITPLFLFLKNTTMILKKRTFLVDPPSAFFSLFGKSDPPGFTNFGKVTFRNTPLPEKFRPGFQKNPKKVDFLTPRIFHFFCTFFGLFSDFSIFLIFLKKPIFLEKRPPRIF